jgi:hypothetical protein
MTEYTEQCKLIAWCDRHPDDRHKLIYSHLNGMRSTAQTYIKERKAGARAGIPDLFLPIAIAPHHGLYIEMKRDGGGVVSPDQKKMICLLKQQGYAVFVANGCEEAKLIITNYLNANTQQ